MQQTFIFAWLGKVTSCDRLIYSFNAVINLLKMDARSTWEVTQKCDPQQDKSIVFFGRKAIYFFNLGIENTRIFSKSNGLCSNKPI